MPHCLIQQTAVLAALFRSIFSNTVAGLITAILLGYWMPVERMTEPAERAEDSAPLNVDPVSGKWLDRIEGAAAAAAARPTLGPMLTHYGFLLASADDAPAATGSVKQRTAPAKVGRPAAKANDAAQKTAPLAAVPAGPELAEAPPAQSAEESESWMSRLSPAKLTARVAPIGRDFASGVASKAAGAGRAVVDRLGGLL